MCRYPPRMPNISKNTAKNNQKQAFNAAVKAFKFACKIKRKVYLKMVVF